MIKKLNTGATLVETLLFECELVLASNALPASNASPASNALPAWSALKRDALLGKGPVKGLLGGY